MSLANTDSESQAARAILVPEDAGPATQLAADELANVLQRMTGHPHAAVHAATGGKEPAVALAVDGSLAPDGYDIRREGETVRIAGGSSRGCLYGTYAWLHSLGCRWPLPGATYEVVPRRENLPCPEMRSEPAIRRRGMVYVVAEATDTACLELVPFLARNGFNYLFLHGNMVGELRRALAEVLNRREMGFEFGGHLLPSLLPRDLFEEHPEYFREVDGVRTPQLNMCPSSDGAARVIAEHAQAWHLAPLGREFERLETLHLWPDDLFEGGWCSCPKCRGLSESDQSLLILNAVAEKLPPGETMLAHCAYHVSIVPPTRVVAHPRVRLMFAPRERSYLHPLDGCAGNRWYHECLEGLVRAVPNEPEVFEYYHDLILFRFLPMPLHPVIGRDVEVYRAAGIDGIASLSFQTYSQWAYGPNTYVLGRALWRGSGSPDDIGDYCRAVFGPAAQPMERYFDLVFELCATAMDTCAYTGFVDLRVTPPDQPGVEVHAAQLAPLVREAHLDEIESHLVRALALVEGVQAERVAEQRLLWTFARQEARTIHATLLCALEVRRALAPSAAQADKKAAAESIQAVLDDIDAGSRILSAAPAVLKGPFAQAGNGAFDERGTAYKHQLRVWLAELGL